MERDISTICCLSCTVRITLICILRTTGVLDLTLVNHKHFSFGFHFLCHLDVIRPSLHNITMKRQRIKDEIMDKWWLKFGDHTEIVLYNLPTLAGLRRNENALPYFYDSYIWK